MSLVAYVSGHGFGHAAREVEILRRLPEDIPLIVKSTSPEWFWRQAMGGRQFDFVRDTFDCGCVQIDSIRIDIAATLDAWRDIDTRNNQRREAEAGFLCDCGARVVVTDVASFPLALAARLGIPGILVANFTWADIYGAFVAEEPAFAPVVEQLTREYRSAYCCLETGLALPMPYLERRVDIGLVSRPSQSRRAELRDFLGPSCTKKRLALIYLGAWGYPIPYERLETFSDWHFLSLDPPPSPVANWSIVPRELMGHSDLVASVDLAISKPGYGLIAECLSSGTPFLYCPRPGFAEYPALEAVLSVWPGGLRLSQADFLSLNWHDTLANVPPGETLPATPADGGPKSAAWLADLYHAAVLKNRDSES